MAAHRNLLLKLLERLSGPFVHGFWLLSALGLAVETGGMAALGLEPYDAQRLTVWACVFAPGLIGLFVTLRKRPGDGARFAMLLAWIAPAFALSAAMGGALSGAALVFLAGPAAVAASARRTDAGLASVMAASGFAVLAAFSILGGARPEPLDANPAAVALGGFLALCAFLAVVRLALEADAAQARARALEPAADAFRQAPAALAALDGDGRVTAVSDAFRSLLPGAPRSMKGLPLDGFGYGEDDARRVRDGFSRLRRGDGLEFYARGHGGRPVRLAAMAKPANDGAVIRLDLYRDDLALTAEAPPPARMPEAGPDLRIARLEAELESLREARDEAVQANRAKSEFLASVSHELRTPLNAIIGFSDVMKQRLFGPMPARYAEYADLIHESGRHLLELIGDVLDMSKIEADRYELSLEPFDARGVIETAVKLIRLRAEDRGLALVCDVGEEPIDVLADRKALNQILLNLLSNAVKFTPPGGAVAVMARANAGELTLAVGDSGVGIAPEELELLGQRYAQTSSGKHSSERGTGLGLSLVQALAALHGGRVTIESRPGEGTTVTLHLPVLAGSAAPEAVEPADALDVRERIRLAQSAGAEINSAAAPVRKAAS